MFAPLWINVHQPVQLAEGDRNSVVGTLSWRSKQAFNSSFDVVWDKRILFLLFTRYGMEQSLCTHSQRPINGVLVCATRLGDELTAAAYFSYPAFGRVVSTPDNAVHNMIKHGPSKFVIELD